MSAAMLVGAGLSATLTVVVLAFKERYPARFRTARNVVLGRP